jgi:hypothetical protein
MSVPPVRRSSVRQQTKKSIIESSMRREFFHQNTRNNFPALSTLMGN